MFFCFVSRRIRFLAPNAALSIRQTVQLKISKNVSVHQKLYNLHVLFIKYCPNRTLFCINCYIMSVSDETLLVTAFC